VLGLVAIVSLFEQYDLYLFSLNLKHIQADLAIDEARLGLLGSIVRAGSLLAVFVTLAADRLGRRRLLLVTVVAYTVFTAATAFAPDATTFVVLQFLARIFATAETLIAVVVIAEEFAPEHRGWGIGAVGAIQGCGAGLAAVMFGFVDVLPFGWRALYLVGIVPLLLVAHWRRALPETTRFETLRRQRGDALRSTPPFAPMFALLRGRPRRLAALAVSVLAVGLVVGPAGFFAPKFLQDVHGWSPAGVATLNFLGGALAIVGNPLAGWLSDRHGRRPVAGLFSTAFVVVAILFYGAFAAWAAPVLWVALIFSMMGTEITFAAFGVELFPTSQRSTASGVRALLFAIGSVAGLLAVSALFPLLGSNWSAITALAVVGLCAPIIVLAAFPETARRTLEAIAPEDEPSPAVVPAVVEEA